MLMTFAFLSLMSSSETCKFEKVSNDVFSLKYAKWSTEIEVLERNAQLVSCAPWKDFPKLLVAVVNAGTAGTSVKVTPTYLYVFDLETNDSKPLLREKIRESSEILGEKKANKAEWEEPYELISQKDRPAVRWKKSKKVQVLP